MHTSDRRHAQRAQRCFWDLMIHSRRTLSWPPDRSLQKMNTQFGCCVWRLRRAVAASLALPHVSRMPSDLRCVQALILP